MISNEQARELRGGDVVDTEGNKIGSIGEVYLDDRTGQPSWVTVNTGMFGTAETFVPLDQAEVDGKNVRVPYTEDKVKDAPRVDGEQHLDVDQEQKLYRHYGLDYDAAPVAAQGTSEEVRRATGHEVKDAGVDREAGDSMTRHEEHLRVGTEQRESGRVRLRKYVTTETETARVNVSHEEARLERTPIADGGRVVEGDVIGEDSREVRLTEEVPVVSKETRAVEEVRLGKEKVQSTEDVSGEVRTEHIEMEGDERATLRDGDEKRR